MRLRIACAMLGLAISLPALAETAVTNRDTALKKEPADDAVTVATLPKKTSVEVLKRDRGWYQVKPASTGQGWVKMLSLDLGDGSAKESSGGGIGSIFNVARTGSTGATSTTGVKGWDINPDTIEKADAKKGLPELDRMHKYTASKADALKFASSAGLHKQSVDYSSGRSSGGSSGGNPTSIWGNGQ